MYRAALEAINRLSAHANGLRERFCSTSTAVPGVTCLPLAFEQPHRS